MRERAKQLREQRETQRLALVDEKLEQRWRNQCEEMRALLTMKHRDEVFADRAFQLKLNAEKRERDKQGILNHSYFYIVDAHFGFLQKKGCTPKCGRKTLIQSVSEKRWKRHRRLKETGKCLRFA